MQYKIKCVELCHLFTKEFQNKNMGNTEILVEYHLALIIHEWLQLSIHYVVKTI